MTGGGAGVLRVVQLGKYYPPYHGGMETHLAALCGCLRGRVALDVLVSNRGARTERAEVDGVPVTRLAELGRVASTSFNPTLGLALARRALAGYDVLHLHLPHPMGAAAYLAAPAPRRHALVVTYHSDVVRQRRLERLYAPLVRRVLARADAVIVGSPNYVESSPVLRAFRDKCRVVPFGIDAGRFAPGPAREASAAAWAARLPPGPRVLGVGRLVYYKGFETAVRALTEVPGAQLVVVGEGPLRAQLQAQAREAGVAERVHLLGRVEDAELPGLYAACDVFALPSTSRSEAFGLVQLEAMACGLPVVNTALDSGVPFVSPDGESGLTVPPGDAGALAAALRRLLGDAGLRRRLGEGGRARVAAHFTQERMAEATLALYRDVVGVRRAA